MKIKTVFFPILLVFFITDIYSGDNQIYYQNPDSTIKEISGEILVIFKNKEYKELTRYIHPVKGVRFSPYSYIDTVSDRVFTRDNYLAHFTKLKSAPLFWGYYDGSGDSIKLTVKKYFKRFVYDADFLNAEKFSVNSTIGKGNTINNIEAIYSGCKYTESYFSGFEEKYGGMDWRALRLVFKEYEGKFYLVGIIHDEWTI
ncbi:MAG: hypothetical protein UZ05_CHB002001694 [Chlorobi bacterium OLB5]|nr:MAG: hypothetical protein UZ05_CHB002001694 [Chlorobi bacterium OLB5]